MDLANLQTFIAIAEQRSFSLAGERLHVTQPAISKRVASLEEQLGVAITIVSVGPDRDQTIERYTEE